MVIRVNISELESKAKYAESLYIQLKIKADEINNLYYTLDPKVKSRNGIGQSMISLQNRIEQAQQKMYNISKFLYSAAENYRNAEKQIVSKSKCFEDSRNLYDKQYSDYNYIKNLNIFEGTDIEGINSVSNVEMDSSVIDYLKKSGNQFVSGNYTEDVTLLGTFMQVGAGLFGVDLPMDLRDVFYDFTHWKWSWRHARETAVDLLALFPIIGSLKYADEASALTKAAFKNTDEASALIKGTLKNTDEISDIAKGVDETIDISNKTIDASKLSDVWKLKATERGEVIEEILSSTEYKDWYNIGSSQRGYFPVIDFQNGNKVISLKTIDPTLSSFSGEKATERILEYLEELNRPIKVDGKLADKILDIRIPEGTISKINVQDIITQSKDMGIKVQIKEFN